LVGAVVVGAYVVSAVEPLARNGRSDDRARCRRRRNGDPRVRRHVGAGAEGRRPRARRDARLSGVLTLGAVERLAGWGLDDQVLWAYDAVVAFVAVVCLQTCCAGAGRTRS
jgi:hypothetical protein